MKRFLTTGLAALVAFSLIACGGGDSGAQGGAETAGGLLVGIETPPAPLTEEGEEPEEPEDRVWLIGAGDDGCREFD